MCTLMIREIGNLEIFYGSGMVLVKLDAYRALMRHICAVQHGTSVLELHCLHLSLDIRVCPRL